MAPITCILTVAGTALALGITMAEPPTYAPVPAQILQTRDGLGNVLTKLAVGEEVKIAYFGGSITAAAGWRVKTLEWMKQTYPDATISEINAAIGGTGSDLGVYRMEQDVLRHEPDLIFVEFSVNDGGASPENIWRGMEGIVRQAWEADPTTDICFVYTFVVNYETDLDQGMCPRAASADEMLAEYYGIPAINVALRTAELQEEGALIFVPERDAAGNEIPAAEGVMVFSDDGVHPLDEAHGMYSEVIAEALTELAEGATPGAHELRAPFIEDNWKAATLVPLNPSILSPGWRLLSPDEGLGHTFHDRMPQMWEAVEPGEKLTFAFKGTAVKLYDILGPDGAQVVCTLDGVASEPRPRFDSYCSYHRLASLTIGEGLEDTIHTVSVEIHPEQPDRSSVVDREKDNPGFDPASYDGTAVRVGSIMIIGELVETPE